MGHSIPDTHYDMAAVRQKTALDYEWAKSQLFSPNLQFRKIMAMGIKAIIMKYGLYIPLVCVAVFFLWGLYTDGTEDWVNQLLTNALVIGLGGQLLGFAVGHIFKADVIAEQIGWKKGSPFQLEVGIANLAIGVLGIMCAWFSGAFWMATVVAATIWLWGCVAGHVKDIIQNKNFSPGSAGFVFYWGLLYPVALIVLLSMSQVG